MRCFLSLSFSKAMMRVEGFFFFTRICGLTLLLQHYLKDKKELLIV